MMRLPSNILRHELIGLPIQVLDSTDQSLKNLSGVIVCETRNTIEVDVEGGSVTLPKRLISFTLKLPDNRFVVADGSVFRGRPEERLARGV